MKKEIKIAILVIIGFLSFLWLEKPLRLYLAETLLSEDIARLSSTIAVRVVLIAISLILIKKLSLFNFTGLSTWRSTKNIHVITIAMAFIVMGVFSNWTSYTDAPIDLVILFASSTLAVGIIEELVFRGTIFPLMIQSFRHQNRPLLLSALLSNFMFGLVHYINLLSQPDNFIGISSQVFFATAIGVFFCGLMVRTENIIVPSIIHALVNFSFGSGILKQSAEVVTDIEDTSGVDWGSVIPTTIFFLFIFIGGVYMIIQSDKHGIIQKLTQADSYISERKLS
jgi:membrane protease YdiL (CAAX protease family)